MGGTTFAPVSYTTLHPLASGHGCHLITAGGGYGPYVSAGQMLESKDCVGFQPQWQAQGLVHGPAPNVGYQLSHVEQSHLARSHGERFPRKCRIASVQDQTGEALPMQLKAGESILNLRARAAIHFNVAPSHIDLVLGKEESLDDECLIVCGISGCDQAVRVVVQRDTPLQAIARAVRCRDYGMFIGFVGLPLKDEDTGCIRVTLLSKLFAVSEGVFDSSAGMVTLTSTKDRDMSMAHWGLTTEGFMPGEVSHQISDELADELCRPWGRMRTILLSFADESTGDITIQCCDVGGTLLSIVTVPGESRLDSVYKEIAGTLAISQEVLQLVLPDGTLGRTLPASSDLNSIRDRHGSP